MKPAARVAAVIDLIAEIDTGTAPADRVLERYFRRARYAGAKDRKALRAMVYGVLRHRGRLSWWLEQAGHGAGPRLLVMAHGALLDHLEADPLECLFDGSPHGPDPLDDHERALINRLVGRTVDHPDQPAWLRWECPEWLYEPLAQGLGGNLEAELAALNTPAPVDFRVNTLKARREDIIASLAGDGISAHPGPHSPFGLRMDGPLRMAQTEAFKMGALEVQDEGSQIIALLTDARPGMTVVDFCAGAGGKTLALAATMHNKGRIFAQDAVQARLARLTPRLERSGAGIVSMNEHPPRDGADRVLVDAPCSGIGRWRRAPEERWRLTQRGLDGVQREQAKILDRAAKLVAPGGRLVYATCSLLKSENQDQIDAFLERNTAFKRLDASALWTDILGTPCPISGPDLTLTPTTTDTDGFFLAVLEKG